MRRLEVGTKLAKAMLLTALCSLLVAPVFGQGQQTGDLVGTVRSEDGQPLPGVLVTVTGDQVQGERTSFSGVTGNYIIKGLPAGEVTVTFELEGMRPIERTATIRVGSVARSDADMTVSVVEETLIVTGEAPTALENTTIGSNYDKETVDSLPLGRTLRGISLLTPNVNDTTSGPAGQLAISGGLGRETVWMLNGVDVTDPIFGTPYSVYIEDAILETQTLTSGISAEYGRFGGGVVNAITKSGGNQFTGSFRIGLTNPSWRNETPLEKERGISRDDKTNETYEATLGGRLLTDKLWFFLAGRDEDTSNQRNLNLTNFPLTENTADERYEAKLTGNIAESHSLQFTYSERDTTQFGPSTSTAGSTLSTTRTRTLPNELKVGRYNGILTSSLFAEVQYSEREFGFRNSGGTNTDRVRGTPFRCWNLSTDCGYNAPYFDSTDPEDRNNKQLSASVSYFLDSAAAGTHDLKIGYEDFRNINTGGNSQSPTDWVLFMDPELDADGNPIYRPDGSQDLIPVWNNWDFSDLVGGATPDNIPGAGLGVFFDAVRGAELEIQTQSLYVNDRWQANDHWSFNIGVRYESNSSNTNAGVDPVDTDNIVPRLAASYDVKGDGKYRVDLTYGEYVSSYNLSEFSVVTNVGNPNYLYGYYIGPSGTGIDFAPGFDINNYFILGGAVPTENVFFEPGLSSNQLREWTLSAGMQLPKGGLVKASFIDRDWTDFVENTVRAENGTTVTSIGAELDNVVYINTSEPVRRYQAIVLQGRYNFTQRWSIDGHWTHQLKNEGNWIGESGQSSAFQSGVGDYPEVLVAERYHPVGNLFNYQEDRLKIWSIYRMPLGRAGDMLFSLLWNYDSPLHYSNSARFSLTAQQRATLAAAGYAGTPATPTLFFGGRGTEEFNSWNTFDFGWTYNIPIWKKLDVYVKADVFNLLDEDTLVAYDTTISADRSGPVDQYGLPTQFTRGDSFGNPRNDADFVTPREYRFFVGLRF